jgi:ribosomal protein L18
MPDISKSEIERKNRIRAWLSDPSSTMMVIMVTGHAIYAQPVWDSN